MTKIVLELQGLTLLRDHIGYPNVSVLFSCPNPHLINPEADFISPQLKRLTFAGRETDMASFGANSPAKAHYFFKIILSDIVSDSKIMIPKRFVRKYGKNLGDHVFLKAPNGAFWQVELERNNGEVWLRNGWQEFATYYSLCFGHVLVFRYDGNSLFHVIIFDKSASEVEYPLSDTHIEQANHNGGFQEGKEFTEIDEYDVSCEEFKTCRSPEMGKSLVPYSRCPEMQKSIVPYYQPYKKTRASSICEEANHIGGCWVGKVHENAHASSNKRVKTKHIDEPENITNKKANFFLFQSTGIQHNRMKPIKLEEDLDSHDSAQEVKGKEVRGMRLVTEADEARTLELAKAFKSDNPFVMVVMHRSYVSGYSVSLSKAFAERYITKDKDNVILQVTDGGTWPAKCTINSTNARFSVGWNAFARDNHLAAGDVCVFELINRTKNLLKVVIFRVTNYTNS